MAAGVTHGLVELELHDGAHEVADNVDRQKPRPSKQNQVFSHV